MSHKIRGRLDPEDAPDDKQTRFEDWVAEFDTVLDDDGYREIEARDDGTRPAYDEFVARFDIRESVDEIVETLTEAYFPDVEYFVVHTRQDDAELEAKADDPDYYDPALETGLRTQPRIQRSWRFTLEYDSLYILVDGEEISIEGDYLDIEPPESGRDEVGVFASADGEVGFDGDVEIARLDVHPGKIVSIDTADFSLPTSEWEQQMVRGDPPDYLANESVGFPDPVPLGDRVRDLEAATGKGGPGERGIAQRIDDIEDRLEDLENE